MMNNTIMEIQSSLEGNNNRLTEEKKWNSELED